ncbi:MAG TPA: helix-turn-helix domain-containing protein [Actinocrinis sp.]
MQQAALGPAAATAADVGSERSIAADEVTHGRRRVILSILQASPTPLSVQEIAERMDVHPNTVRFHLDRLVEAGRAQRLLGEIAGPGRPPIVYRTSRTMDRSGPSNYRLMATMLTSYLATTSDNPAATAAELGRAWGPSLVADPAASASASAPRRRSRADAVARTVALLDELGFEPEPPEGPRAKEIRLRHCPFLDLVDDYREVVCAVHLGLMQGVLGALGGRVDVERLEPFAEPDLCVARLTAAGAGR